MMTAVFVGLFIGVVFLAYEMLTAPEGYEDEYGFHYGKQQPSLQADQPRRREREQAGDDQGHGEVVIVHRSRIA